MKKISILILSISFLFAQNDSITTTNTQHIYKPNDTLVDFNKLNGGVIKFQVDTNSKSIINVNGLEVTQNATIIVKDPTKLSDKFSFEIKTNASDEEWYINTVIYKNKNDKPILHITSDKIEMATGWRKDGKIYVVIAVASVLFFVIILYLIYLERKTTALSKKINL